jgi:tRNA threonylcarbamoyladenosine biosynthesis protein TsaB
MKTLALDTSGPSESVALLKNGKVLGEIFHATTPSHSESLLPSIQSILEKCGLTLGDIDLFAVTVGPGSFTGLRIGISTVKAFAKLHQKPVAPVSTLLALAEPYLRGHKVILPCMDARLGEVYAAAYQLSENSQNILTLMEPRSMPLETFIELAKKFPQEKLLVGSASQVYPELHHRIQALRIEDSNSRGVKATVVGRLGELLHAQGRAVQGEQLEAQYLRVSEAENRLRQKKE